jgi:hypothetical protein
MLFFFGGHFNFQMHGARGKVTDASDNLYWNWQFTAGYGDARFEPEITGQEHDLMHYQ